MAAVTCGDGARTKYFADPTRSSLIDVFNR